MGERGGENGERKSGKTEGGEVKRGWLGASYHRVHVWVYMCVWVTLEGTVGRFKGAWRKGSELWGQLHREQG